MNSHFFLTSSQHLVGVDMDVGLVVLRTEMGDAIRLPSGVYLECV